VQKVTIAVQQFALSQNEPTIRRAIENAVPTKLGMVLQDARYLVGIRLGAIEEQKLIELVHHLVSEYRLRAQFLLRGNSHQLIDV
jgi:hypothetical protein